MEVEIHGRTDGSDAAGDRLRGVAVIAKRHGASARAEHHRRCGGSWVSTYLIAGAPVRLDESPHFLGSLERVYGGVLCAIGLCAWPATPAGAVNDRHGRPATGRGRLGVNGCGIGVA